ncbi:MAG: N-acetylmuramic acid 6-phosphate etherase [Planctomycetota bacterium]
MDRGSQPSGKLRPSEEVLAASENLHRFSPAELMTLFESEDRAIIEAVARARGAIQELGEGMAQALREGGRIIYVGAGTSGRLGFLDASEWPPTFGTDPEQVVALLAGGESALRVAVEGAEDRAELAYRALEEVHLRPPDLVVGLSASGTTRYVRGALEFAWREGCVRAFISCHPHPEPLAGGVPSAEILVQLSTGPEVVAGSTRLKAAAATHMVLQRASTLCALRCGWIYAGRMVEMRPRSEKLRARAVCIVSDLGAIGDEAAATLLGETEGDIKLAILMARSGLSLVEARRRLAAVDRDLTQLEELS